MRTFIPICSVIGAVLLCGCTTLVVKRATPGYVEGIPYTLPKKTFVVTVSYELKECVDGSPPEVKAGKTVAIAPTTQPDENERFYIPYSSLRNWWKDSSVTVESFNNQTLKSVTTTITDKTGDAITSIVSTAIKLSAFGGVAPARAASPKPKCNPDAVAALKKLADLKAKEKPTEQDTAMIADLRSQLTHKEVVSWSPAKAKDVKTFPKPLVLETKISPGGLVGKDGAWVHGADPEIAASLQTTVQLTVDDTVTPDPDDKDLPSGFLFRQGPSATLRVCEQACPTPDIDKTSGAIRTDETHVLSTTVHVLPQLGSYVGMPLKNRLFENQTLAITLSEEGAITKVGITSNATAVAALQNLGTQVDALSKAKEARDKADAAAAAAQQSAKKDHADQVAKENNAIADCLKAQKALREGGGTVTGTCQ